MTLIVVMKKLKFGHENSWTLGPDCSSDPPEQHGSYSYHTKTCTIFKGDNLLTCKDSFGDGWHGGFLIIENQVHCHDFLDGLQKDVLLRITGTTGILEGENPYCISSNINIFNSIFKFFEPYE